jgi:dihydropteroate synthase
MGVLNATPDSFSDGGRYYKPNLAVKHINYMLENGADIIDIGGESTRPGSDPVSIEEELKRIIPIIDEIKKFDNNVLISVDTYKSAVAYRAIDAGADIINDISGLAYDEDMAPVLAKNDTPVVIMHIKGRPKTMQKNISYNSLIDDIKKYFIIRCDYAIRSGIKKNSIILDPGIGFGKTFNHNFKILKNLKKFKDMGLPILIGPSRKAFIGDLLDLPPNERLEGTIATVVAGILNGANMVRVHDVKEIKRAALITEKILSS